MDDRPRHLELPAARWRHILPAAVLAMTTIGVVAATSQEIPFADPMPGRIVYTRAGDSTSAFAIDVFVADANGENERQLTNTVDSTVYGSAVGEDQPRWSPDGEEVSFFTLDRDGLASIWIVPQTGGTPTPVVRADGEQGGDPAWHRDGQCLVYAGAHGGSGDSTLDLKRACRDGSGMTLLATDDLDERAPDVSPDGQTIVYQSRRAPTSVHDRFEWSLRLIDIQGGNDRLLYEPPTGSATNPRWSPNGQRIAFVAGSALGLGTLSVLDLASGEVTPLARIAGGPIAWSPDGQYLLFYNTAGDGPRLTVASRRAGGAPLQEAQNLGLYLYDFQRRGLWRLRGAAGGADAAPMSYRWGAAGDWWGPSPTPSATTEATAQATATEEATEPATPTAEATTAATSTATATTTATASPPPTVTTPTPTTVGWVWLYLPIARKD